MLGGIPEVNGVGPYQAPTQTIGTLRYTTARCYYGYFGRDGLG